MQQATLVLSLLAIAVIAGCADSERMNNLEQRLADVEQEAGELGDQLGDSARQVGQEAHELGRRAGELGEAAGREAAELGRRAGVLAEQATLGKPTLVINLTAGPDDPHAAAMGLHLAEHGLAAERQVVIFFNVKAVELARKDLPDSVALEQTGPIRQLVAQLVDQGAVALVCPMCAEVMGVKAEDLAPGITLVSDRMQLFDHLHANAVVFTY